MSAKIPLRPGSIFVYANGIWVTVKQARLLAAKHNMIGEQTIESFKQNVYLLPHEVAPGDFDFLLA